MSTSVDHAKAYYDSSSADKFYFSIWGGNDIHIGIYASPTEPIAQASQRTVSRMAQKVSTISNISHNTRILDLGSGFGGSARWLAKEYGCKVTCLNISEVQNVRNRTITEKEGLAGLIEVIEGNFEELPFEEGTFDVVWSQDSFLHSSDRGKVISEISRVLVPRNGVVVFTDPMASANASDSDERLVEIKQRLQIDTFGSRAFYREGFGGEGFEEVGFEGLGGMLVRHYGRVLEELRGRREELIRGGEMSEGYVEGVERGLRAWVKGGEEGMLDWGIHLFRR